MAYGGKHNFNETEERLYDHLDNEKGIQVSTELTEKEIAALKALEKRNFASLIAAPLDFRIITSLIKQVCAKN